MSAEDVYGSDPNYSDHKRVVHVGLGENFEKWITKDLGIPQSPLRSLEKDDDWSFVIKMHAIVEAGLNHMLMVKMNDPKLADIIPKLETNNRSSGKMAFLQAYDLLPANCCLFVELLSSIRNAAVHDAKNFNLDIKKFIESKIKDPGQRKRWKTGLSSWWISLPKGVAYESHEAAGKRIFERALDEPKHSIFSCAIHILALAHVGQLNAEQKQKELEDGFYQFVDWPSESTPKQ